MRRLVLVIVIVAIGFAHFAIPADAAFTPNETPLG